MLGTPSRCASATEIENYAVDDLDMGAVAARLGKSKSWLQYRLAEDRERAEPGLQHHHYIGRSPRWDESEYQALRAALIKKPKIQTGPLMSPEKARPEEPEERPSWAGNPISDDPPVSPSRSETDFGTSTAGYASADVSSASARVQNFPLRPAIAKPRKSSADKKRRRSATNSSGGSVHPFQSRSRSSNI
jgi:predicted DNA-binding transcriptional regulator AlpA